MKTKLLLSFSALFITGLLFSQSIVLTYEGEDLEPNAVVEIEGLPSTPEIIIDMDATNTNSNTLDILVQRYELDMVEGASSLFCWGLCFPPTVSLSPYPVNMGGGQTIESSFQGHYMPAGNEGTSTIAYTFFDENNPNDSTMVTVEYKATLTGISKNIANSASVYPNPANESITIELTEQNQGEVSFQLIDITGKMIREIKTDNQKVQLNTSDISEGIYFYRAVANNKIIASERIVIKH